MCEVRSETRPINNEIWAGLSKINTIKYVEIALNINLNVFCYSVTQLLTAGKGWTRELNILFEVSPLGTTAILYSLLAFSTLSARPFLFLYTVRSYLLKHKLSTYKLAN